MMARNPLTSHKLILLDVDAEIFVYIIACPFDELIYVIKYNKKKIYTYNNLYTYSFIISVANIVSLDPLLFFYILIYA